MIQQIGQIGVPVKDVKRATLFYRERLGLQQLFETENMAFFECEGIRIMLTLPENEAFDHPGSVIYFNVPDIEEAYQQFEDKGVSFLDQPHVVAKMEQTETWMTFFNDTEGNTHALMSEVRV
ncbi:VOC family protein [Jeotgalibacillus salarius]|uniref:VOC family protein n=1 Tax=Jeotgalibacillus salarius TaxID=546023 RepID=A0A4Y8LHA0_9BACL|nr:VOC family protein [Jeotgalibacillus salarius]